MFNKTIAAGWMGRGAQIVPVNAPEPEAGYTPAMPNEPVSTAYGNETSLVKKSHTLDDAFKPILGALGSVRTEQFKERRDDLILRLNSFRQEIAQLVSEEQAHRTADLRIRHESLKRECRASLDESRRLSSESGGLQDMVRQAQHATVEQQAILRAVRYEKPPADSYPTSDELDAWRTRCNEAERELARRLQKQHDTESWYRALTAQLQTANEKLRKIAKEEEDMRAQLEGRSIFDREFGLMIPPGS